MIIYYYDKLMMQVFIDEYLLRNEDVDYIIP